MHLTPKEQHFNHDVDLEVQVYWIPSFKNLTGSRIHSCGSILLRVFPLFHFRGYLGFSPFTAKFIYYMLIFISAKSSFPCTSKCRENKNYFKFAIVYNVLTKAQKAQNSISKRRKLNLSSISFFYERKFNFLHFFLTTHLL